MSAPMQEPLDPKYRLEVKTNDFCDRSVPYREAMGSWIYLMIGTSRIFNLLLQNLQSFVSVLIRKTGMLSNSFSDTYLDLNFLASVLDGILILSLRDIVTLTGVET